MTDRAYTVAEIDALREACECKYLFGSYRWPQTAGSSRSYGEAEKIMAVEEMTRTFMLAGKTADDLRNGT